MQNGFPTAGVKLEDRAAPSPLIASATDVAATEGRTVEIAGRVGCQSPQKLLERGDGRRTLVQNV